MKCLLHGNEIELEDSKRIGSGGEAEIYRLGRQAVKIYKKPDHPDYALSKDEQKAAEKRIGTMQQKLLQFPTNLPACAITPTAAVFDRNGRDVIGYAMPLISGANLFRELTERNARLQYGTNNSRELLLNLHQALGAMHMNGVVIGDFNDLNIMVKDTTPYLIDLDSAQFGKYLCTVFTARFVDPLLCDPDAKSLELVKPHNQFSDWYSYAVMTMELLLCVDPYGGVYVPLDKRNKIAHDARPLKRITVFHPEVRYPKPALPYQTLPDELLHYWSQVFEKDHRGIFPRLILENMRSTKCTQCGTEHAKNICPNCQKASGIVVESTVVRGSVMATTTFKTKGLILAAVMQQGSLRWLYHENGEFKRENGKTVLTQALDPQLRVGLQGEKTLLAKGNELVTYMPNGTSKESIDVCEGKGAFSANSTARYLAINGRLQRDGQFGPEYIGDVLADQTRFWIGENFGFGFYRAGKITTGFVFDAQKRGLNDRVKIAPLKGQLLQALAVFAKDRCWFFTSTQEKGKTIQSCQVITQNGEVLAQISGEVSQLPWLEKIGGQCAVGQWLFAPSDEGIVRLEIVNGHIVQTRDFPDSEPFVDAASTLFAGNDGIWVVSSHEIKLIKMK